MNIRSQSYLYQYQAAHPVLHAYTLVMARLAESRPSSDNDLPDLNALVRKSNTRATKASKTDTKSTAAASKPTSRSGIRRVRKLGDSSQTTANPLFQRWGSGEVEKSQTGDGGRIREPRSRVRQGSKELPSHVPLSDVESEDDEPQPRARAARRRRQIVEDSDDDFSGSSSSSEEGNILTRVRNLQRNRSRTTTEPPKKSEQKRSLPGSPRAEKQDLPPSVQDLQEKSPRAKRQPKKETDSKVSKVAVKENSKARKFAKDLDSGSESETAREETGDEDPSVTAEDDSDGNQDSAFDSGSDESPFQPSRKLKLKPLTSRTRIPPGSNRSTSSTQDNPFFNPRISSQQKPSSKSQKGDASPAKRTISTKSKAQGRKTSQQKEASKALTNTTTASDLADTFSKLRIQLQEFSDDESKPSAGTQSITPPNTPPKAARPKGLVSPTKNTAIPKTPHRPSTDAFWSQELVNDWNDVHSPRKLMLPPITKNPAMASPQKSPKKDSKKAFEARKHALAESFLKELDAKITGGMIAKLAESTGGVKVVWTKTLNTTAGRASWRRETIRRRKAEGSSAPVEYKHHAAIELAEKVIDDEHRLLNVMAHEFCHLANFMVTGMTTNPHGKEFKAWAGKCSAAFAHRGIDVTTKHSYEIDFKFVWACADCGAEYKRHSRSIDPARHRCGSCKGMLNQTKPVPRGKAAGPSRYQVFVKEQMAVVKAENPGSPQKDVMKLVAQKWAKQGEGRQGGQGGQGG